MLGIQKIRQAFQHQGFNPNSNIRRNQFYQFLNALLKGEVFDEDVADELWEQAAGGPNVQQIKVDEVCRTIEEGQNILRNRLAEIDEEVRTLERQRQNLLNSGVQRNSQQIQRLQADLQALYEDKREYEEDLRLVTQPFGIRNSLGFSRSRNSAAYGYQSNALSEGEQKPQAEDLKWILYLTLIFGAIQIIIIYGKYDFLNLIVLTCLLSIYLLNHFDETYIKLTLVLLSVSEILDVIWLFMYASQKWNPPTVGNNSTGQVGYLRFIVFFTIMIICLKVPLGYFLFKYRNANSDKRYSLNFMGGVLKIVLSANKSNPITRGIKNSIQT